MKEGNWMPIDKHITTFLPKHRPYTEAEAFLSVAVDADNLAYKTGNFPTSSKEAIELILSKNSISGYASLWGWTRGKARRFLEHIKTDSGHPTDTRRTGNGHPIRLIFNNLQDSTDGYRTDSGQIVDTSYNTNPLSKEEVYIPSRSKKAEDPDVQAIVDHYYKVFEEVMGVKPTLGKADAPTVKKALKNGDIEQIKNLVEYAVDVFFRPQPEGKGWNGTLKTCFTASIVQARNVEWQKRKWQYDSQKPVTAKRWWR